MLTREEIERWFSGTASYFGKARNLRRVSNWEVADQAAKVPDLEQRVAELEQREADLRKLRRWAATQDRETFAELGRENERLKRELAAARKVVESLRTWIGHGRFAPTAYLRLILDSYDAARG